jgi:hypothetical protein
VWISGLQAGARRPVAQNTRNLADFTEIGGLFEFGNKIAIGYCVSRLERIQEAKPQQIEEKITWLSRRNR